MMPEYENYHHQVSGDKNITSSVLAFAPKYQDFGKNLTCKYEKYEKGVKYKCHANCKYITSYKEKVLMHASVHHMDLSPFTNRLNTGVHTQKYAFYTQSMRANDIS